MNGGIRSRKFKRGSCGPWNALQALSLSLPPIRGGLLAGPAFMLAGVAPEWTMADDWRRRSKPKGDGGTGQGEASARGRRQAGEGPGSRPLRIVFAGGGTGGHIYMAVALAERLRAEDAGHEFLFVGTKRGLEKRILTPLGYQWTTIQIGGLKRVGLARMLHTLSQVPSSVNSSRALLDKFRPDLVVGLGGYSAGPVAVAARWLGVPLALIEPNVLPGLTNRLLLAWAECAAVAFEETVQRIGSKAVLTGIPVRRAFHEIQAPAGGRKRLRLLAFGGSQGSHPINQRLCAAIERLSPEKIAITHQTGPAEAEEVKRRYRKIGFQAEVTAYIDDMARAFAEADLILARSGASTVAEIAAAGRPSLLMPLPGAADDHQRRNAQALAERGAARILEQSQTDGKSLAEAIRELEAHRGQLREMAQNAKKLARPEAVEDIVRLFKEVAE